MKTDYTGNASSSGTTSTSAPRTDDSKLSEPEFLEKQAQDAQAAIGKVLQDLKAKIGEGVDPKAWAQEHPWIAIGAAAVAGFAATAALVPSKEEQALKKLASIERALNAGREQASNGNGKHEEKGGTLKTILAEAAGLLRPLLASVVAAQMGRSQGPPQRDDASTYPPNAYPTTEQGGSGV